MSTLESQIDQEITVRGTARNAAAGAVVLTPERTPVYVAGLDAWDLAHDGQPIAATGTLRKRRLTAEPVPGPRGEQVHGIPGEVFVLERATWTLVI